jgi:hypothetical protein
MEAIFLTSQGKYHLETIAASSLLFAIKLTDFITLFAKRQCLVHFLLLRIYDLKHV